METGNGLSHPGSCGKLRVALPKKEATDLRPDRAEPAAGRLRLSASAVRAPLDLARSRPMAEGSPELMAAACGRCAARSGSAPGCGSAKLG